MKPVPDHIRNYLANCEGAVEANSYETMCLWKELSVEAKRFGWGNGDYDWVQNNSGCGCGIGEVAGKPVFVSLLTNTINGQEILFYEATSQIVDHEMVEEWLKEALPDKAKYSGGYVNKTNAMNFTNILKR